MSKADALRAGHEAWRAAGGERPAPCDPLERARRNPQSRQLAIAGKCFDCMGGDADPGIRQRIRACPITRCPLHAFRPYQRAEVNEPHEPPHTLEEP